MGGAVSEPPINSKTFTLKTKLYVVNHKPERLAERSDGQRPSKIGRAIKA